MDIINYEDFAKEIQQKQEQAPIEYKEAAVSVLQEKTRQQIPSYQPTSATITTESVARDTSMEDLPSYAHTAPVEAIDRVKQLIATTLEKGIARGISEMLHDDPFVIDMYHDALADHVLAKMKERGLL